MSNLVDLCCLKKKLHGHLTDKSSIQNTKIKVVFIFEHYLPIFMDFLINSLYSKNEILKKFIFSLIKNEIGKKIFKE